MSETSDSPGTGPATSPTLLSRMRQGDEAAWAEGLRRYTELAFGFLTRLGLSVEDAEDVWQEAWLRVWRRLQGFDPSRGRFRSWLLKIMQNQARDWNRRLRARKRDERLTEAFDAPASADQPEGPSRWEELEGRSLDCLEERCRKVEQELRGLLHDYSSPDHLAPYLDWFFNGAPAVQASRPRAGSGGRATKPNHDTNETIAARHRLTVDQLTYRIEKVEAHLRKRWSRELPNRIPHQLP